MIERMMVVTPPTKLDRSAFDPRAVANFERVTGILHTRRWSGTATELAKAAIDEFRARWGEEFDVGNHDAIVVVTQSQDRKSPCMAAELHAYLGMYRRAAAFDVNQSCDGFIYGLEIARRVSQRTLLVCVDMLRAREGTLDSLIFSDAACVVSVDGEASGYPGRYLTLGMKADALCADRNGMLCMDGPAVFDFVTTKIPKFVNDYPVDPERCDFLCLHQANKSMMDIVDKRSGYTDRSLRSIHEYGNMSMVSIPAALAHQEPEILGKTVLMCGFGAGFCAAAMAIDWPKEPVASIVEV